MKKVLFIAPYRQADEWGEKARTLASMINEHADLTLRPIWFNSEVNPNMHLGDMEELENKNELEFDIVIQFGLPNHFAYDGRFKKNIAITSFGCVHKNIDVSSVLNLFDKVAVFSSNEIEYAFRSGIPNNKIINFGCDPFIPTPKPNTTFDFGVEGLTFYTMAGLSPASGLRETLAAYLSIPRDEDKTTLAVVTNHPEEVKKEIQRTQEILGICAPTEYRKIAICNPTDAKDSRHYKDQAHLAFDVFVNVGYNASQCKDTLLAYSADNRVISPRSHNFYKNYTDKVKTIEVTRAMRETRLDGLEIRKGQFIAILSDEGLIARADKIGDVILEALGKAGADKAGIVTIYYGAEIKGVEAQEIAQDIRDRYHTEVEVVYGGQPHYNCIISLE